jgi:hypothetical protein
MEPTSTGHTCPKCGSTDYLFRGRKKVAAEPGKPPVTETKYRCKGCGHEWRFAYLPSRYSVVSYRRRTGRYPFAVGFQTVACGSSSSRS